MDRGFRRAGAYRGGLGNRKEYESLGDATVTLAPRAPVQLRGLGVFGGKAGQGEGLLNPAPSGRELRPLETSRMAPGTGSWSRFRVAAGTATRTTPSPKLDVLGT